MDRATRFAQQTSTTAVSDGKLIEAFRDADDASAYSELVRRHQIGVFRLLTGLLADPDLAEPACEDVFVRAARRLEELPDPQQLPQWLGSLAQQLAQEREPDDQAPQQVVRLPYDATLAPDQGKKVVRGAVREVLASLPGEQRSVLILAELHGEPVERIAATLGLAPSVVRERLKAARLGFARAFAAQRKAAPTPAPSSVPVTTTVIDRTATVARVDPVALVPGYELGQQLGAGGMARVLSAIQQATGRSVAVKLVTPEFAAMPGIRERFDREALAMQHVQHPNLVEYYEHGRTADGGLFLAMERLDGRELFDLIGDQISPRRALHILQHVLVALNILHRNGIVHRDVKPENVFVVERDGDADFAKLIDLGIARLPPDLVRAHSDVRLTKFGTVLGTPTYLSPEQAIGRDIDARADLYSASVMLFEMLTGQLPFMSEDVGKLLAMHVSMTPPRLRSIVPSLKGRAVLEPLVARGMAKQPYDRFDDAEQYLAATREALAAL